MVISLVFIIVALGYFTLVLLLITGFKKTRKVLTNNEDLNVTISVILPFFNEEENLGTCLGSIVAQKCKNTVFEIIAVNDKSTDGSVSVVEKLILQGYPVQLIQSGQKGKKQALLTGINLAKGELIITVDADCYYPPGWLQAFTRCYRTYKPVLMIGPVKMDSPRTWFEQFQFIDFMSLVGSGAGAAGLGRPILCNGANLAFSRSAFQALDNPLNLAYLSGDDVFLLHKMKRVYPGGIRFINHRDAVAETKPARNFLHFFHQRSRWASKTPGYSDFDSLAVAALVGLTSVVLALGWTVGFFNHQLLVAWLALYLIKLGTDGLFLYQLASLFGNRKTLLWLPVFEFLFAFYVTSVICVYPLRGKIKKWK